MFWSSIFGPAMLEDPSACTTEKMDSTPRRRGKIPGFFSLILHQSSKPAAPSFPSGILALWTDNSTVHSTIECHVTPPCGYQVSTNHSDRKPAERFSAGLGVRFDHGQNAHPNPHEGAESDSAAGVS